MSLRCCGRFAYWRPPFGPWSCSSCGRTLAELPIPRSAVQRFDQAVAEMVAKVPAVLDVELLGLFFVKPELLNA